MLATLAKSFGHTSKPSTFSLPTHLSARQSLKNFESSALNHSSPTSFRYTGTGKPSPLNLKLKNFKKKGPIGLITGLILLCLLFFGSLSTFLGNQIEELITRATDPQYTTYTLKVRRLSRNALKGKAPLPDYFVNRLKKQGITTHKLSSGGYELEFKDSRITADNFDDVLKNNPSFRESFNRAKRGRVANFFDRSASKVYQKLGKLRNVFNDFRQTGDHQVDEKSYHQTMKSHLDHDANLSFNSASKTTKEEPDGTTATQTTANGQNVTTKDISGDTSKLKAENFLRQTAEKVSDAGGIACAALKVGNMVSIAVAANEVYQVINFFHTGIENSSKTRAGYGNQAAINPFLNSLYRPATTTYLDADTSEEKTVTGSMLESEGLRSILTETAPNPKKTKHFSLERLFQATGFALVTNKLSTKACSGIRATGAVVSLATTALLGGGFIKATFGLLLKAPLNIATQIGISNILRGLIPFIANSLFTDLTKRAVGIPGGELFASGASAANSRLARSSSGFMPSSADSSKNFHQATVAILNEERLDRAYTSSPFDLSNPDSFLGSILLKFSLLPKNSTLGSLHHLKNLSLTHLSPSSFANEETSFLTTYGNCPTLEAIGVKGDAYCNPIMSGDLSTIDLDLDDPIFRSIIEPNLHIKDNRQTIIPNSNLANFITYCTERDSPFGVVDANIANAFQSSLGIVGDNLPVVEDIVDIVNAAEETAATPWATGEICTNSSKNPRWESEMKYYQHYIETTRLLDQMGFYKDHENPVIAFKDSYEKTHPIDQSPSGYLSRISGLKKSDAETVLAFFDYLAYLEHYKPSSRHQFVPLKHLSLNFKPITIPQFFQNLHLSYFDLRSRSLIV